MSRKTTSVSWKVGGKDFKSRFFEKGLVYAHNRRSQWRIEEICEISVGDFFHDWLHFKMRGEIIASAHVDGKHTQTRTHLASLCLLSQRTRKASVAWCKSGKLSTSEMCRSCFFNWLAVSQRHDVSVFHGLTFWIFMFSILHRDPQKLPSAERAVIFSRHFPIFRWSHIILQMFFTYSTKIIKKKTHTIWCF